MNLALVEIESTTTYNVEVHVLSEYLPHNSRPEENLYAFAYHVHIHNKGDISAQLLRRHWIITDGNQHTEEVKGDGVIGEQPFIRPGEAFNYSSGTVLRTPVGSMRGSYQLIAADGTPFNAPIYPFTLAHPRALH